MRSLFISYARADRPIVQRLVPKLEAIGYDVWWDHELLSGVNYIVEINKRLRTADCALVLWSEHSVNSEWVLSEAETGRGRGVLKPMRLGEAYVPSPFNALHTVQLPADPSDQDLEAGCRALIDAIATPKAAPPAAVQAQSAATATQAPFSGKRILALDGGGARVAFQCGVLEHVEAVLRDSGKIGPNGVLADYFDLIGGISAGSAVAALLAQGRTAAECSLDLVSFAREARPKLSPAVLLFGTGMSRGRNVGRLRGALFKRFGDDTLETAPFKTMWATLGWRVDKPGFVFFAANRKDPIWDTQTALQINRFPLRSAKLVDLIAAAMSLPGIFPPVAHEFGPGDPGVLFDAATMTSNPSLALYSYATRRDYGLSWTATPEALWMLSVGSGVVERALDGFGRMPAMIQAVVALSGAVDSSTMETVQRCQEAFETKKPFFVRGFGAHIGVPAQRKFARFQRIDAMLEPDFVRLAYGVEIDRRHRRLVRDTLDATPSKMALLREIGKRAAAQVFTAADAP